MGIQVLKALAAAAIVVVAVAPGTPASAAGIVTHAWMAEEAAELVADPALTALLRANLGQLRAGAAFPDGGYATRAAGVPGGDYGEEAHWQRFQDAYLDVVRARPDCGDLARPEGPCAPEVAHLLGVAAHGMGDEVWDWLFEPAARDHGEVWIPPELADRLDEGGIEVQMDVIAIGDHGRPAGPAPPEPSTVDLVAAFAAAGHPDITPDALIRGRQALDELRALEAAGTPTYREAVRAHMPRTVAGIETAPGGVHFAARAIAAVYETLWARLAGRSPATRVSVTTPGAGQLDVPRSGWVRSYLPGSGPAGGGALTRITAVLSSGLPYVRPGSPPGTHIDARLPAGAAVLAERESGRSVALAEGYPRIAPYDPDAGAHLVAVQPAADLAACTWYRVSTTEQLLDAGHRPVTPAVWEFRTDGCAPAPARSTTSGTAALSSPSTPPPRSTRAPVAVPLAPRYAG